VNGDLGFRIVAPDPCVTLDCDPATGCTATTLPVSQSCCSDLQRPRLAEAAVLCPQGRLLQIGRNADGFGRLNSCDYMRFRQRAQADAEIRFHIRVSCVNPLNRVTVKAKLVSATRGTWSTRRPACSCPAIRRRLLRAAHHHPSVLPGGAVPQHRGY
jgi:hypothetical protein